MSAMIGGTISATRGTAPNGKEFIDINGRYFVENGVGTIGWSIQTLYREIDYKGEYTGSVYDFFLETDLMKMAVKP